jgi:hypothetical protein
MGERRRRARARLDERARDQLAMRRALDVFRHTRKRESMGAFVLRSDATEVIVRVMYMNNRIPPDRAWYAVPTNEGTVRELSYVDVAAIERTWR